MPAAETLFTGSELLVYGVNQGTWRRLYGAEGFVPGKSEAIVEALTGCVMYQIVRSPILHVR